MAAIFQNQYFEDWCTTRGISESIDLVRFHFGIRRPDDFNDVSNSDSMSSFEDIPPEFGGRPSVVQRNRLNLAYREVKFQEQNPCFLRLAAAATAQMHVTVNDDDDNNDNEPEAKRQKVEYPYVIKHWGGRTKKNKNERPRRGKNAANSFTKIFNCHRRWN